MLFEHAAGASAKPQADKASVGGSLGIEATGYRTKSAILHRLQMTADGPFGLLQLEHGPLLHSGELPWKNNMPGRSCIPQGQYRCTWAPSAKLGRACYHVRNVPGRSHILIHPANFCGDADLGRRTEIEGCITMGMTIGNLGGQMALLDSRKAVSLLEDWGHQEDFDLTIL